MKKSFLGVLLLTAALCADAALAQDATPLGGAAAAIANPWVEMTAEELRIASGFRFSVPEGARDVIYRYLPEETLSEMLFGIDGDEYCARTKPSDLAAGGQENISGMYYYFENEEEVTVAGCPGTLGLAKTGSREWVELCLWTDAEAGRVYSLSVWTMDPDGLDLTAVAEAVLPPEP